MAKIKSHTDLGQSKKLSEFLPIESADLWWDTNEFEPRFEKHYHQYLGITIEPIPCWSLTALLNVLTYPSLHKTISSWRCDTYDKEGMSPIVGIPSKDPIDACYEMILELHELKIL